MHDDNGHSHSALCHSRLLIKVRTPLFHQPANFALTASCNYHHTLAAYVMHAMNGALLGLKQLIFHLHEYNQLQ